MNLILTNQNQPNTTNKNANPPKIQRPTKPMGTTMDNPLDQTTVEDP